MVWDILTFSFGYCLLVYRNAFLYFVRLGMQPKAVCLSDEHCIGKPRSKLNRKGLVY